MESRCGLSEIRDKHRISKREKPIAVFDGNFICVEDMLPSGQRRDEHDERALREVKIRDECIQAFELITGVDENIRPAGLCAQRPVGLGKALDRAAGRCADADDAAAARLRLVDDARRFLRNDAKL